MVRIYPVKIAFIDSAVVTILSPSPYSIVIMRAYCIHALCINMGHIKCCVQGYQQFTSTNRPCLWLCPYDHKVTAVYIPCAQWSSVTSV